MAEKPSKKPRSFFSFWGGAIKTGWRESREKFGSAIDLAAIGLGLGLFLVAWYSKQHPKFKADEEGAAMSYWFAVIPVGMWLLWLGWHILRAPYDIYKEQFEKHEAEIGENKSEIKRLIGEVQQFKEQTAPLLLGFEITEHHNGLQTSCTIVLQNPNATQRIDGVELSLISISPPIPHGRSAEFTTDSIKLVAINFSTQSYGMNEKKLTGMQKAFFPVFVVFETNPATKTFFHFTGDISTSDVFLWQSHNSFAPQHGLEYTLTFQARARGLMQAERQFKLKVFPSGIKPQMTFAKG